jgi:hypothetical protein
MMISGFFGQTARRTGGIATVMPSVKASLLQSLARHPFAADERYCAEFNGLRKRFAEFAASRRGRIQNQP